jgi:hypothetical protein
MYNLIKNKYLICYFQSIHTIQTMQLEAHSHHAPLTQAIATYADGEYRKPVWKLTADTVMLTISW